ncbi:MAG: M55 family metallopeptidase [Desulfurococcaceae archaeon]
MHSMKAYVSVDVEGLPGVVSGTMLSPWSSQFARASKVMTKLTNIVVDELFKNGFSEVYVADSHGLMTNIEYLELDSRATIIQGYPRPFSMVSMLDDQFAAIFFLGYHAAAGTRHGILEHTYSGRVFFEIRVNGVRSSEFLINSLYAGELGVPVALLAGDDHLRREVEDHAPWAVFVPLKKGVSRFSAISPGLAKVEEMLRAGVREACEKLKKGELRTVKFNKPYRVELVFRESLVADALENWDIMERIDAYTLRFTADTAGKLFNVIEIASLVGYAIESFKANLR